MWGCSATLNTHHSTYFQGLCASASSTRKQREGMFYTRERQDLLAHHCVVQNLGGSDTEQKSIRTLRSPPATSDSDLHFPKSVSGRENSLRTPEDLPGDVTPISGKTGRMWAFLTDHRSYDRNLCGGLATEGYFTRRAI